MARPLKPFIRGGGFYPSRKWTPLVYPGGYATANSGGEPEPEALLKTVTGSLIHITDALALPAKALSVKISPIQDLHGYDNPWPAGGGKNLCPPISEWTGGYITGQGTISSDTSNGEKTSPLIPVTGGQIYTFSYDLGASISEKYWSAVYFYNSSENPVGSRITNNAQSAKYDLTATAPADAAFVRVSMRTYTYGSQTEAQVELGASASAYSPYSNICPISGRTSATVTRTGKNLLPKMTADTGTGLNVTVNNDGSISVSGTASSAGYLTQWVELPREIESGTAWTFGTTNNVPAQLRLFLQNGTADIAQGANYVTVDNKAAAKMRLYLFATSGAQYNFTIKPQLEFGSTATTYAPYSGNTYTIQLGQTVYGGTLDVTAGKMVVTWVKHALSEATAESPLPATWYDNDLINGDGTFGAYWYWHWLGFKDWELPTGANNSWISDKLKYNKYAYNQKTPYAITIYPSSPNPYIAIRLPADALADTSTDANLRTSALTWLANNPVDVAYELATPIEITLTPQQIEMLLGENNLWSDADDSTLTYYAEGEASTSEALGILLGGTYNNPGGADDVSDDEALGILLRGS